MRVEIKVPKTLAEEFENYCTKEGRVKAIFCQDIVKYFFASLTITRTLILLQPKSGKNTTTLAIELEEKIAIKVQALVDFFKCEIESVLYSIFVITCFHKNIFDVFEQDYQDFCEQYEQVMQIKKTRYAKKK